MGELIVFDAVGQYKSVKRAIRRGNVSNLGISYPSRPFNNRKNTSSRKGINSRVVNEEKKRIYARLKGYNK